jgi:hypothetical protein
MHRRHRPLAPRRLSEESRRSSHAGSVHFSGLSLGVDTHSYVNHSIDNARAGLPKLREIATERAWPQVGQTAASTGKGELNTLM